jgi:hypothetical protein
MHCCTPVIQSVIEEFSNADAERIMEATTAQAATFMQVAGSASSSSLNFSKDNSIRPSKLKAIKPSLSLLGCVIGSVQAPMTLLPSLLSSVGRMVFLISPNLSVTKSPLFDF